MATTGRTSERVVNGRVLTLTWYRCQICFSLSAELERPGQVSNLPDQTAGSSIDVISDEAVPEPL